MKKAIKLFLLIALSILLAVSFVGCAANEKPPAEEKPQVGDSPQNGSDEPKEYNGEIGNVLTEGYPAEIQKYLEENKLEETQQAFNINNKTYLVLTMGEQSSAGYAIELKDLVLADGTLKVFVKYVKPGKDAVVATVITYPSLVIETDKIYEGHYEIAYDIKK